MASSVARAIVSLNGEKVASNVDFVAYGKKIFSIRRDTLIGISALSTNNLSYIEVEIFFLSKNNLPWSLLTAGLLADCGYYKYYELIYK